MDATGELSQLRKRVVELAGCFGEELCDRLVAFRPAARETKHQGQPHETLLGTVVEVAFDPLLLPVRSSRNCAAARDLEVEDLSTHLGLEPLAVDGERSGVDGGP